MDSRSSSPQTPDVLDEPRNVAIHNQLSWCHLLHPLQSGCLSAKGTCDGEGLRSSPEKRGDERMLELNDLIDEHAYDDSPGSGIEHSPLFSPPPSDANCSEGTVPTDTAQFSTRASPQHSEYQLPSYSHLLYTPAVPPPAMKPRKRDSSTTPHRVVHPAREFCYDLSIVTPNIPKCGTKSRVETQVRVTVDLAHASSSSCDPYQYDRVGSWKWLKLPPGTATKRRTRREGKIDPAPVDILHLTAAVTCATPPHNPALSCGSCRNREAKRVARKLAARVRPARSDSDGAGNSNEGTKGVREDTTSIIQFNCPEVLDFSNGSAVLPVRITCYCRHHRERVGFNVHFTMMDHCGRVVGTGTTPPIMITDDHKSTIKSHLPADAGSMVSPVGGSSIRAAPPKNSLGKVKNQGSKRAKPYDPTSRSGNSRFSREASVISLSSSVTSPSIQPSTVPHTRSPTPLRVSQSLSPLLTLALNQGDAVAEVPTQVDGHLLANNFSITNVHINPLVDKPSADAVFRPSNGVSARQLMSPVDTASSPEPVPPHQPTPMMVSPHPIPFMFFDPASSQHLTSPSIPRIHRLIPSSGPTYGGVEVTILGENFHPAVQLNCVFGDVAASSTQRWSDNTLLCVLPPRATPGVVAVWFEGISKSKELSPPPLFTYTDESDRALMELALQVVGLKMTGKIEDAKNVALRIVGTTGTEDSMSSANPGNVNQAASTSCDIRPLLLIRLDDREKFELSIIKLLSVVDLSISSLSKVSMAIATSHATPSGQTLLHLAVFLDLAVLTEFLIAHDVDLDVRDCNGYTALHFAVLARSKACAKLLVEAGADLEIVNALGQTPQDMAPAEFFGDLDADHPSVDIDSLSEEDDGESQWGDIETDEESMLIIKRKQAPRSIHRRSNRRSHDADDAARNAEPSIPQRQDTAVTAEDIKDKGKEVVDEKQAASFVDTIQRILAQLHAQGIIPNMPQLPLPHLPEIPTVPWAALPHIHMVFPVFVPMPGWPSFLSDKREGAQGDDPNDKHQDGTAGPGGQGAARTAQELWATWERWIALTAALRPQPVEEAPPMYTARESPDQRPTEPVASTSQYPEADSQTIARQSSSIERSSRRVSYEVAPVTTQDVDSYGYMPAKSGVKNAKQKHDRMLVLFWLPILLVSLLWAFHNGIRFVLQAFRTTLSLKAGVGA